MTAGNHVVQEEHGRAHRIWIRLCAAAVALAACFLGSHSVSSIAAPGAAAPHALQQLAGKGEVPRSVLTRAQLFATKTPSKLVDDTAGFAIPADAAEPSQKFEGTLTLKDPASNGNFSQLADVFKLIPAIDSPWKHLAPFQFQFVQSGSYLIPAQQGLTYVSSSPTWNYILGPGRVWNEKRR